MSDDLSKYDGHVPGPWAYKRRNWKNEPSKDYYITGNQYEYDPADEDEEGEPCLVSTAVCIVPTNDTSHPVCFSTARLIADAPLLLARVRTLEADLRRAVGDRAKLREALKELTDTAAESWPNRPCVEYAQGVLADLNRPTPTTGDQP